MQKHILFAMLTVAEMMSLHSCHREWSATDEAYYTRFDETCDTSLASYKACLKIAVEEVVRIGRDTAKLELYESKEDSATYLFRFGPKPPTNWVMPDGTIMVISGGGPDIFIRKSDCKIERRYMTK